METERDIIAERYYHGIDIIALLFYVLKRGYIIVVAAIIGAAIGRYYAAHCVTPVYQATSKIYLVGSETSISIADLQLGSSLAIDYQELFKVSDIHEKVAELLGLDCAYDRFSDMVSVGIPSNSHVMYINVRSADPEEAMALANAYAGVIQDYVADQMEMQRPLLLEKARKPAVPISPNLSVVTKDSAVAGGLIPAIILVLLCLVNGRIRSAEDIEAAVALPVIGALPLLRSDRARRAASKPASETVRKAEKKRPGMPQAIIRGIPETDDDFTESLNALCSGIMFAKNKLKTVAVTSCSENEGKTFTSFELSVGMAGRGLKTLLIDCDLRKSVMARRYRIQFRGAGCGLAHLLSGQCALSDAVCATDVDDLYLIPAGRCVKTPMALLTSAEFDDALRQLRASFDMIVMDAPPVGTVIDAAEIARRCDGSVLVVENRKTQTRALKAAVQRLSQTGAVILGCVLNRVKAGRRGNAATGKRRRRKKRGFFKRLIGFV